MITYSCISIELDKNIILYEDMFLQIPISTDDLVNEVNKKINSI